MFDVEFRTDDLPPADRFRRWYDFCSRAHPLVHVRNDQVDDFTATARVLDLGGVLISELTHPPLRVARTPALIRRCDPGRLLIVFPTDGRSWLSDATPEGMVPADHFIVWDTSRPHLARTGTAETIVQVSKAALPLSPAMIDRLVTSPVVEREGVGRLVSGYLDELVRHADRYRHADGARLATVTIELFAALLAHHLEAGRATGAEDRRRQLQARIHDFVHRQLADPTLSPGMIASAHHISLRYLHKLFASQGLTVAGWIRQQRLERSRRDLLDPRLSGQTVQVVAVRSGFTNVAHFTRLFRAAYGHPPDEYRRRWRRVCPYRQGRCVDRQ